MTVVGLVTEYNPFHNGHAYHMRMSREITGADGVVCVMSGNFIQRGEPAIINKWARTEIALSAGADLVIELPAVFAAASAEYFAFGAVKILDSLGIVDYICFGSEAGDVDILNAIADILVSEPQNYKSLLKQHLSTGISYPSAREKALADYISAHAPDLCSRLGSLSSSGGKSAEPGSISSLLAQSNNILAIEYLKALKKIGSNIRPTSIKRVSSSYNDENLTGTFSSATAIRNYIFTGCMHTSSDSDKSPPADNAVLKADDPVLKEVMPECSRRVLTREMEQGRGPVRLESFENLIFMTLRKMALEQIAALPYVSEGLENRMKTAAENSGNLAEFLENASTKRYPRTRIQRALISMLTGLRASELEDFMQNGGPQYIRILGFSQKGRDLLSRIKKKASLPVITKTADHKNSDNPYVRRMLEIEATATDIYVLGYDNPLFRKGGQEYTSNIVRL